MRIIPICFLVGLLTGCTTHDAAYYRTHPKAVFSALQACEVPADSVKPKACPELERIAQTFRGWMNQIQSNSQAFGQEIIKIQQECSQDSLSVEKKQNCHQELEMRLAMVKWLESPES